VTGSGLGTRLAASWRSGPLSIPAFRLLTAGQFTSNVGDYCYAVALPWLVLSNHGDAAQFGVVLACYGIPRAALTTVGGVLADRIRPRTIMLVSDAVRCVLTAVFAVFAADHTSSLAALAPVAAVLGASSALFIPASYTIMPSLLDGERLSSANAIYQGFIQVGSLIGPVIGGVIVATAGATTAFGVDAASYLVSAGSLAFIGAAAGRAGADPRRIRTGRATRHAPPDAKPQRSGWHLLLHARVLQVIFLVSLTSNFALIAAVALALVPFRGGLPGAAAAMLVFGVALGFDGVLSITLLQEWAPEGKLGRVMGVTLLAGTVSFPIAGALLAAAMLGGLSQREFRSFGVGQEEAVPERVLGGARLAQVGLPLRVAVVLGADQAPVGAPRNVGDHGERPAQFG
jgi:MFS family permease